MPHCRSLSAFKPLATGVIEQYKKLENHESSARNLQNSSHSKRFGKTINTWYFA